MDHDQSTGLTITLQGKQHLIACPIGKEQALIDAADLLNQELGQFKARAATKSDEKAILMVALNLCNRILTAQEQTHQQNQRLIAKLLTVIE